MPILPNKTSASRPHAHTSCTARTVEQCPHEHERKRVVLPGVHELPHAALEVLPRPALAVHGVQHARGERRCGDEEREACAVGKPEDARRGAREAGGKELGAT